MPVFKSRLCLSAIVIFSAMVFSSPVSVGEELQRLLKPVGGSGLFGAAVATDGEFVVVGDYNFDFDSTITGLRGAVFVHRREGNAWGDGTYLVPPALSPELQYFGTSVDIDLDRIVVGAEFDFSTCTNPYEICATGAVHVFRREDSNWVFEDKLVSEIVVLGSRFGRPVGISGDLVIAGADVEETDAGWAAGAAYIFRREGETWVQEARLTGSDPIENGHFGVSVAIDGDRAIVGAHAWTADACDGVNPCERVGAAYIFRREGTTWVEEARLTLDSPKEDDLRFGISVDLAGDVAVVGGWVDSAYVYRLGVGGWSLEAVISEETGGPVLGDYVSKTYVRIDGATILMQSMWLSPNEASGSQAQTSLATYHGEVGRWDRVQSLVSSAGEMQGYTSFKSTAFSSGVAVVGDRSSEGESALIFAVTESGGAVPAVSTWGIVGFSMLLLIAATLQIMRRGEVRVS